MSLRRDSILFLVVGCAYALGSQTAFQWFDTDGFSATFFPASGVTLSALALTATRRWPVVLAAVFTAEVLMDLAHDIPADVSIGYAFANVCEPLIGATLLRRFTHTPDLSRSRDLFVFLSCAVVAGPAVGGVIGATNYVTVAGGTEPWGDFMTQWWIGDGLGVLVVASAVLAIVAALKAKTLHRLTSPGAAALIVLSIAVTGVIFTKDELALAFVAAGLLGWLAFSVGTTGVALAGFGMAFVAAEATSEGHRFFEAMDASRETGLVYLQVLLGFLISGALALAAEISERERSMLEWGRSEEARRRSELIRAAEREAHRRAELLQTLADRMSVALTREEIAEVVAEETIEHLGARSSLLVIAGDSGNPLLAGASGYTPENLELLRDEVEGRGSLPVIEAFRSGERSVFTTAEEGLSGFEGIRRLPLEFGAVLAVPLKADGEVVGALSWGFARERSFDRRTADLAEAIASQSAVALARARLSEVEHRFALEVQRMMLGPRADVPDGISLATRYLPSEQGLNVGGDWYDVERRSESELCIAIGDLVGRGLPAAAAMGRLQSAANALVRTTRGPAELLEGLDRFVVGMASAEFSTACAARIEVDSGRLRFASAGHLPPLLVSNGTHELLVADGSIPLGIEPGRSRVESAVELTPGSLVALYTDGLVERRDQPIDTGIEFLAEVLTAGREQDLDRLIDEALEYLVGERGAEDDIALVLIRYG